MKRGATYRPQVPAFGSWLLSKIKEAGLNQGEFADRVGVSRTTVSRWVNGRVPDGTFIDPIADVLLLEYDIVATKAGYRPRGLLDEHNDPDSPEAILCGMVRRISWDPGRFEPVVAMLRSYLDQDQRARKEVGEE